MADDRMVALRRKRTSDIPLLRFLVDTGPAPSDPMTASFRLLLPDDRCKVSLRVGFAPNEPVPPTDARWAGLWNAGKHGLVVQARDTAGDLSNKNLELDNLFGIPGAPVPVPGGVFGWILSDEPEAREWLGVLSPSAWNPSTPYPSGGLWFASATIVTHAPMSEEEWVRVANRFEILSLEPCRDVFHRSMHPQ